LGYLLVGEKRNRPKGSQRKPGGGGHRKTRRKKRKGREGMPETVRIKQKPKEVGPKGGVQSCQRS